MRKDTLFVFTLLRATYCEILFRHLLEEYPSAICLDGTPAGYYHTWQDPWRMAQNPYLDYYIHFEGLHMDIKQETANPFSCTDEATCQYLCYKHPETCSGPEGFMIQKDENFRIGAIDRNRRSVIKTPYQVWAPYCSHDSYLGNGLKLSDLETNSTSNVSSWETLNKNFLKFVLSIEQVNGEELPSASNFTFAGKNIFTSVFYSLLGRTNISNAENIVVTGHSEGRHAVSMYCKHLQWLFPHSKLICLTWKRTRLSTIIFLFPLALNLIVKWTIYLSGDAAFS